MMSIRDGNMKKNRTINEMPGVHEGGKTSWAKTEALAVKGEVLLTLAFQVLFEKNRL
jgi:hypothetical protein